MKKKNNNEEKKDENKYVNQLKKFGGFMKKSIFTAGKVVKETSVKGYNYVKEKTLDKKKEDDIRDDVWLNYMDNIDSNRNMNNNNNGNNNNFNNYNQNNNNNFNNYNQNNNNNYNQNNNFNNQMSYYSQNN